MNGIITYTDNIIKYMSGKKSAGKNIQTTDGFAAYITSTGVAKPYKSIKDLNNKNGCTTKIDRINTSWGDMGFPVGSLMVEGQSCGNETKYIRSNPPQTVFDWKFYVATYPDLNLTNEAEALDHWNRIGMAEGLLPNDKILLSMTNLGKIGYVDINTELHTVPLRSHKYTGIYKTFKTTNVTGSKMVDCTAIVPPVKYGDQIYIKSNDLFAGIRRGTTIIFGLTQTPFFLRPPPGSDSLNGTPIKYGDEVNIAQSSSTVKTNPCGWYGCKVWGFFTFSDFKYVVTNPGGDKGGAKFKLMPPPESTYELNSPIHYLDPFMLVSYEENNDTLKQQESLNMRTWRNTNDNIIASTRKSKNGRYLLYMHGSSIRIFDNKQEKIIWEPYKNSSENDNIIKSSSCYLDRDGNLILINNNGQRIWTSNSSNKGVGPYSLVIQNDGNLCIFGSKPGTVWSSATIQPDENTPIIQNTIIGYVGQVENDPDKMLFFDTMNKSENQTDTIFSFQDINISSYGNKCNIPELQNKCNKDPLCTGFIYQDSDNTWQKLLHTSTKNMFKITNTIPQIFIKEANVDMRDQSCVKGTPTFVDSVTYMNYPKQYNFIMGGNQCNAVDRTGLLKDHQKYKDDNENYIKSGKQLGSIFPNLQKYTNKNENLNITITNKSEEYKKLMNDIDKKKSKFSSTLQQHQNDLMVLENTNKANSLLWGISALVVIGVVVAMRNRS